jgi:hypothetical protein
MGLMPRNCTYYMSHRRGCQMKSPTRLLTGERSFAKAIQACSKVDGLKSVSVCCMVIPRKTDGYG